MNDVLIREATTGDLPAILELYAQPSFNGAALTLSDAEEIFRTIASYPDYRIFVAESEGAIIGTYCLLVMDNIAAEGRKSAIIESVVMSAAHQGSGFGKVMMNHAVENAEKFGAYKVALFTGSPNDYVHRFYEGLGFERHGISYRLETGRNAA